MAREGINIGHILHEPRARRSPAHTARKRDDKASMATLIGADLEQVRRGHAVKPGPIGKGMAAVDFARECRHQGDAVCLTMTKGVNGFGNIMIIHINTPTRNRLCGDLMRQSTRHFRLSTQLVSLR